MRKSVIAFLTMLTLALGIAPAFALAAEPGGGSNLSPQADMFTVTFVGQDGTAIHEARVAADGNVTQDDFDAAALAQKGYSVKSDKWYSVLPVPDATDEDAKKGTGFDTSSTVTESIRVYAEWDARTYVIEYANGDDDAEGDMKAATVRYKYGEGVVDENGNALDADGKVASNTNSQAKSITVADNGFKLESNRFVEWNSHVTTATGGTKTADGTPYAAGAILDQDALVALEGDMDLDESKLTLTAQWQPVWTVTLDKNKHGDMTGIETPILVDATYEKDAEGKDVAVGKTIKDPGDLSEAGYDFDGWFLYDKDKDELADTAWKFDTDKVTGDITLKAKWSEKEYTVAFHLADADIPTQSKKTGETVTAPTKTTDGKDIAKTGHHLYTKTDGDSGWYSDEAYTKPFVFGASGTLVDGNNVDLYAKWEANTYKISFDGNDNGNIEGNAMPTDLVKTYGVDLKLPANTLTHKDNKAFLGWKTGTKDAGGEVTLTGSIIDDEATITTDLATGVADDDEVTLYAVWEDSFYITFSDGDAAKVTQLVPTNSTSATLDAYSTMAKTIKKDNYTFAGWNSVKEPAAADAAKTAYTDGQTVTFEKGIKSNTEALKLYAQWAPNTYSFEFNLNGGSAAEGKTAPASQYMQYGVGQVVSKTDPTAVKDDKNAQIEAITFPADADLAYTGYKFKEWNTQADGKGDKKEKNDFTNKTSVTADTVLYAIWEPAKYKVTYKTLAKDTDYTAMKMGADGKGMVKPTESKEYEYGVATNPVITIPEVPYVKTGYTAEGWKDVTKDSTLTFKEGQEIGATDLDRVVELAPNWVANTYTVEFYNETGETLIASKDFAYDAKLTWTGEVPAKEQSATQTFEFAGWATEADAANAGKDFTLGTTGKDSEGNEVIVRETSKTLEALKLLTLTGENPVTTAKLYAVFAAAPRTFTVSFDASGVETTKMPAAQEGIAYEGKATAPAEGDAVAEGYTFAGWYTDKTFATEADFSAKITEDTTFYAKWTPSDETKAAAAETATEASGLLDSIVASKDGKDVASDKQYVDQETYDALKAAVDAYNEAVKNDALTGAEIAAVEAAQKAANDAKKDGANTEKATASMSDQTAALAGAKTLLAEVNAGQKSMSADAKAALEKAIADAEAAGAGKMSNEQVKALNAATAVANQAVADKAAADKAAADANKGKTDSGKTSTAKKANNPMKVKQAKKAIKAKATKKTTVKGVLKITGAKGKVTVKTNNKKVKVTKAGKVTVKKGLKKATTVKITITAAGDKSYNKATKTLKLKIKVAKK